jgi:hypothetical protein
LVVIPVKECGPIVYNEAVVARCPVVLRVELPGYDTELAERLLEHVDAAADIADVDRARLVLLGHAELENLAAKLVE